MKNSKIRTRQEDSLGSWLLVGMFGIVVIMLSCTFGELIGAILSSRLTNQADPSKYLTSPSARIFSGCISGLLTGVLGWVVLRTKLKNKGLSWHLTTLVSVLVCETIVGFVAYGGSKIDYPLILFVSAACGFTVGLAQWLFIRNASPKTFIWVAASSGAWFILTATFVFLATLD